MRRTKAEAEETRQNIILAAERVFYEKGVANSSLEDVAAVAGVTRGATRCFGHWLRSSSVQAFTFGRQLTLRDGDDPAAVARAACTGPGARILDGLTFIRRSSSRNLVRTPTVVVRTGPGSGGALPVSSLHAEKDIPSRPIVGRANAERIAIVPLRSSCLRPLIERFSLKLRDMPQPQNDPKREPRTMTATRAIMAPRMQTTTMSR